MNLRCSSITLLLRKSDGQIMDKSFPILIFKGDKEICYGALWDFSIQLKDALSTIGEEVLFFDPQSDDIRECFGKEYKAIVGFMESFFYNTIPGTDTYVFDQIEGPKFNYWPDHPAFYYRFIGSFPKDYYVLTLDRNYVSYVNSFYQGVTAYFLPPGGRKPSGNIPFLEREYDVSFLGTYVDYRSALRGFNDNDEVTKIISNAYLEYMIKHPMETTEQAFIHVLGNLGANVTTEQFLGELCKVHRIATMGAARYYKEKVIQTIIEKEITVDVFGESWKSAPFAGNKCLRIHPEVGIESANDIYGNSKVSLNIMTWHKDSITERVIDAMISGSIVLTDDTPILREYFEDSKDILYFSLDNIQNIPDMIRDNLNNARLALSGQKKALRDHLWIDRAKRFLEIIENLT